MVLLEGEEGGVRNVTAFELFSYLRTPAPPFPRMVPPQWGEDGRGLPLTKHQTPKL